mmetsp:Transcript_3452/g.9154  ORF Transcript_3452/g.9154 Transcript_3452/m.9154 type:complete len:125 (+) Transcript_3452:176-550(+)
MMAFNHNIEPPHRSGQVSVARRVAINPFQTPIRHQDGRQMSKQTDEQTNNSCGRVNAKKCLRDNRDHSCGSDLCHLQIQHRTTLFLLLVARLWWMESWAGTTLIADLIDAPPVGGLGLGGEARG